MCSPVEINQYDITMAIHYDITMYNDVARIPIVNITMGNNYVASDVAMCTYHSITMHDIVMKLFYYVSCALCQTVLFVFIDSME